MHPLRRRKLSVIIGVLLLGALAAGLVLYALRQNISLFYTPSQIMAGSVPTLNSIRVGGVVVKGSIQRDPNSLDVQFKLTDYAQTVTIKYQGVLPDLFREEQGVIAQGKLQDDFSFQATQVLAKHDENYMPPEVKASLQPKLLEKLSQPIGLSPNSPADFPLPRFIRGIDRGIQGSQGLSHTSPADVPRLDRGIQVTPRDVVAEKLTS